ncbi:MAG: FtsW/RodA/SpoVE family cell cycle protein [Candidatus Puniceispirillaceae bacterium]|jgi:cell division protein FtsW
MLDRTDRSLVGIWWWTVDKWLLAGALILMVLGALLVMAAGPAVANLINLPSQHFMVRQLLYVLPSLAVMITVSMLEPRPIRALSLVGLAGVIGLMIMAIVAGSEIKGATRWITLFGFNLQPSEFAKPLFAIVSAWLLTLWREGEDFPGWIYSTALLAGLVTILVLQPDIGMTAVIVLTWGFQMFLAGMPMLFVIGAVAIAPLALYVAYLNLDHVTLRINKFFEGGSWQVERARQSFAEGGLFGVGPGDGTVKLNLPDAHSDFIFAVAAEEYGALACLVLLGIYGFIVMRGFARALSDEGLFCLIAASSLVMQIGVQAAIHMASSVDLIPTKGMTLPFVSYGGSSLLASGLTMGLLLALTRRRNSWSTFSRYRTSSDTLAADTTTETPEVAR